MIARKYQAADGHPERFHLITFEGAFHGRTLATIAAGGNQKYIDGFGPKVEGFDQAPWGDLEAVEALIGPQTAGVLVEPVQGEGGIRVATRAFIRGLRELCDERGLLLVGLDSIGEWLTEVNVTSPTCFREIMDQTGFDVAGMFIDALETAAGRASSSAPA